jgi:UDP-N-acetylglucosamine 2-epimerase
MITHIVGARPQFIKLLPLYRALAAKGVEQKVLHSGQHWEPAMSEVFFADFGLQADHILDWSTDMASNQSNMEQVLAQWRPQTVVVYGDTYSTLCGARAASSLSLNLAHVEAGLRSFNSNMPEEACRVETDHLADWHFAPSETAMQHLRAEGLDRGAGQTINTGDIMADGLMAMPDVKPDARSILVTLHRNTNVDDKAMRESILSTIHDLASPDKEGYQVVWPLHPRLRNAIGKDPSVDYPHIQWLPPLSHADMIQAIQRAEVVLTDSGGVQKEAYFLKRHCVVLRTETEWKELLASGCSTLLPPMTEDFYYPMRAAVKARCESLFPPIYGDGKAAEHMANALVHEEGLVRPRTLTLAHANPSPLHHHVSRLFHVITGWRLDWSETGMTWSNSGQLDVALEDASWMQCVDEGPTPFVAGSAPDYLASILWAALRREEWGSESLDEHGRYQAVHSVMAQRGWLSTAICHRWAGALMQDHQLVGHRQVMAQPTVIIDVDHLRAFDGYPLSHRLLTLWRDLLKGKWTRLYARLLQDIDPFDAHDHLAMLQLSYPSIRWQAFAWVGPERNDHDHGLPGDRPLAKDALRLLHRIMPSMGIHPSYHGTDVMAESALLAQSLGHLPLRQRRHYLKMRLPDAYEDLPHGMAYQDWSMSYANSPGYRSGMGLPYPWLRQDGTLGHVVVPSVAMDQHVKGRDAASIARWLHALEADAMASGHPLVIASHWRFFGPNPAWADADCLPYLEWVKGLKQWMKERA